MFGARRTQLDDFVDRATSEMLTGVDWQQNMVICDLVARQENGARDCVAAISRRLQQKNPNVLTYTIALTQACVKNCGLPFHREIASRNFLNPVVKLVTDKTTSPFIREKLLMFLQECANEFRYDPSLGLLDTEFQNLKRQGVSMPAPPQPKTADNSKDLQKEEEELQLALALSMSEAESKKAPSRSTPDFSQKSPPPVPTSSTPTTAERTSVICTAKALYDFGGTEKGEIGFKKGDTLEVTEKVHANWWKGFIKGQSGTTGLFPANYVEEVVSTSSSLKTLSSRNDTSADPLEDQINEESVNRLLELLRAINPQKDNIAKNEEIQDLFQQCNEMRPKVLELMIKYDKKKEDLLQLNEQFIKAKASYERLLAASVAPRPAPQQQQQPAPQYQAYGSQYPPSSMPPSSYSAPHPAPGYPPQYQGQGLPPQAPASQPQYVQYAEPPRDTASPMRAPEYQQPAQGYSTQPSPYYPPATGAPQYGTSPYPPTQAAPQSYDPSAPPPSPSVYPRESPFSSSPSTFQEPPASYGGYPPQTQPGQPLQQQQQQQQLPPQQQHQGQVGGYSQQQHTQPPPQNMYGTPSYGAPPQGYTNTPPPSQQPEVSLIDLS